VRVLAAGMASVVMRWGVPRPRTGHHSPQPLTCTGEVDLGRRTAGLVPFTVSLSTAGTGSRSTTVGRCVLRGFWIELKGGGM
jgi:hypothetical protein